MKRCLLPWLLVVCGLAVPAAAAQSSSSVISFGTLNGHQPLSVLNVPEQTSGELTVSFHGDPSTGCAVQGICSYSGTVVFRPGGQGYLSLLTYRLRGRDSYQVGLALPPFGTTFTGAQVTRAGGGVCSDAAQPNATLSGTVTGGEVAVALVQPRGGLLSTRCAGPLDADLAGAGPVMRLTLGQLRSGHRTLPLSGTWSFSAGGFAGTVQSNLTMALGKPAIEQTRPSSNFPEGVKTRRDRQVTETLTLVRGAGSVSLALGADPSTCQFLDSCGIHGTIDGALAPTGAIASLLVQGPATRPYVDFLAALGLSRRGNPHGLEVNGVVDWLVGGTVTAHLEQGPSCTSSAPMPEGSVILIPSGRRLTTIYSALGAPRTRCPGPELAQSQTLASGGVALSALRRPTFTLRLTGRRRIGDDGYTVNQRTTLALTLKRGRVRQQTLLVPTG
jgi:hypothetical protein